MARRRPLSYSEITVKFRQTIFAMAVLLPAGVFAQQSRPVIVGTFTSSASVIIDDVEMRPTAAASWPLVEGDEIAATAAPALLTTADGDLVTFERESKARVKTVEGGQPYIYVREGGVLFETKTPRLDICIGNRLFIPGAGVKGTQVGEIGRRYPFYERRPAHRARRTGVRRPGARSPDP